MSQEEIYNRLHAHVERHILFIILFIVILVLVVVIIVLTRASTTSVSVSRTRFGARSVKMFKQNVISLAEPLELLSSI